MCIRDSCNINLKLGVFYWLFNVVDLHRWHHSKKIEQSNNNYGNNLIIYDRLFGTYYHPQNRGQSQDQNQDTSAQEMEELGEIGLLNSNYPKSYLGQLRAPFIDDLDKEPVDRAEPN